MLPVILFAIILGLFISKTRDFEIKEALLENDADKVTIPKDDKSATLEVTFPYTSKELIESKESKPVFRPSTSRYIALITSLVTIVLVVCMSSFFIYFYIKTGCPPKFENLTAIIVALGLGVTPYITNKITTSVNNKLQ